MWRPALGLAQWPTSWTTGLLTLAGGAEVGSLSFLGLFLLLQEEGGEEKEAQEGEADDLRHASQGQYASGGM